jgi:hypothetical protein
VSIRGMIWRFTLLAKISGLLWPKCLMRSIFL